MLNFQLLQRQRARLYKNDLRHQFQQKQQMRKNQSMQLKSRDQEELKQKMEIAQKQQRYERERDFYLNARLKEENMMLATLKNMEKEVEQSVKQQVPIKGHSLLETLYKHQENRGSQIRNVAYKLRQQNHQQQNLHKMTSKQIRSYQLQQDQKHMQRLKQIQLMRKQQYEDIKNRHSPEPKVGEIHKRLQDMNQEYRRSLESFAYNGRDILDVLKRDDSKQIFDRNRRVQSEIKNQMEEKKIKDEISKQQYIGQPDDLKKSILGSVLFKGPNYDKKEYGNFLMKQINQTDFKRSTQKIENKQKVQVGSIFGGQGGPQRLKMIKYIDQNLGIESEYLKNIEPGKTSSSPYRIKNLYSGEEIHNHTVGLNNNNNNRSRIQTSTQQLHTNQTPNPQKLPTQPQQKHNQPQHKPKPQSSNQHTIRLSSSRVGNNNQSSPKSYLGYDLIKGQQYRYEM